MKCAIEKIEMRDGHRIRNYPRQSARLGAHFKQRVGRFSPRSETRLHARIAARNEGPQWLAGISTRSNREGGHRRAGV